MNSPTIGRAAIELSAEARDLVERVLCGDARQVRVTPSSCGGEERVGTHPERTYHTHRPIDLTDLIARHEMCMRVLSKRSLNRARRGAL